METKHSFLKLFNISFGFFGVQIAYALQSANISRIFATLGADPHDLSLFWILPPLMGMIVQPLVGKYSDKTWCKLGRRKPYLLIGSIIAVAIMILLPNSGNLFSDETARQIFLGFDAVIWFGIFSLIFLDTSINIAMQPFKMMVGDMVNEEQKGLAYSIQSFICNAGSLVGYLLPIFMTTVCHISNQGGGGRVADSVTWAFYIGAIILILCVLYTFFTVKELDPAEYAEFHGLKQEEDAKVDKPHFIPLLIKAPKTFWTVGLVQFFCWAAFLYMWTYTTGATAQAVFKAPDAQVITSYTAGGEDITCKYICRGSDTIVIKKVIVLPDSSYLLTKPGTELTIAKEMVGKDFSHPQQHIVSPDTKLEMNTDINVASKEYGDAGDWVGVLFAVQAIGSIIWALIIPMFKRRKTAYAVSLILGAIGFISTIFITDQSFVIGSITIEAKHILWLSFLLIGCAWAAMLAIPFTILTNSLDGKNMGFYLGLFNCTICLPQIIAALSGGKILSIVGTQSAMLVVAGVLLLIGSLCIIFIKEHITTQS